MKILDRQAIDTARGPDGVYRPVDPLQTAIGCVNDIIDMGQTIRGAVGEVRQNIRNAIRQRNPNKARPRRRRNPDVVDGEEI